MSDVRDRVIGVVVAGRSRAWSQVRRCTVASLCATCAQVAWLMSVNTLELVGLATLVANVAALVSLSGAIATAERYDSALRDTSEGWR